MLLRFIICILALIPFVACSVDDSSSASGQDEYGEIQAQYYCVQVSFEKNLDPDTVYITFVDSLLREIRTFGMKRRSARINESFYYESEYVIPSAPYVKISMVTYGSNPENGTRMEFSRFASTHDDKPVLNIYTALATKSIERHIKQGKLDIDSAMSLTYAAIDDFFGFKNFDFEHEGYWYDINPVMAYIYCRYFISDSVFFKDFKNLEDAIDNGEWGDTLFRVRAADELLRHYDMNGWKDARPIDIYHPVNNFPDFWEIAYGMDSCTVSQIGDSITNANRRSDFYDSIFVCDQPHDQPTMPSGLLAVRDRPHWRLITPDETKFGLCLSGREKIVESDSVFYHCGKRSWEVATDTNDIIKLLYKECNSIHLNEIYNFRGTNFMCYFYPYIDSSYAYIGAVTSRKYAWKSDTDIIDSVYPGGIPDSKITYETEGKQ